MKNKNYILRLLTLVIYFLPFSFFYSGCEGNAYNKADAVKLEKQDSIKKATKSKKELADSTISITDSTVKNINKVNSSDIEDTTTLKYKLNEIGYKAVEKALMPTKESISALGITQVFENMFGRICIILSIVLSIILLITERFFRDKNKLIRNLLLFNLGCVIAFIIDGFIYKVDLLFGVWCLLIILLLQLYLELKRPDKF